MELRDHVSLFIYVSGDHVRHDSISNILCKTCYHISEDYVRLETITDTVDYVWRFTIYLSRSSKKLFSIQYSRRSCKAFYNIAGDYLRLDTISN